jgi:hypothetical protein
MWSLVGGTLVALALVAAPSHATKVVDAETWLAATGDFAPDGDGAMVAVADRQLAVGDCSATPGRAKRTKKALVLTAAWPACAGYTGKVRLKLRFAAGDFDHVDARVKARRFVQRFRASRTKGNPGDCGTGDTFDLIQRRIFGPSGCRVITCHGSTVEGGLDLQSGAAYDELVGVPAENTVAAAASKLRVVPGDSSASFLVQKLAGTLATGEGDAMPLGKRAVSSLELDLVRAWIDAGAPRTGKVEDAPCPPKRKYQASAPLDPPPGGLQFVLDGPTLQPGEELEGCEWVQVPEGTDFFVGKWEYSLNPGTHHFAVWEHRSATPPPLGVFAARDTACIGGGARFAISISGAPEAPYFVDAYPSGIGKRITGGSYLGLNPHYYNEFDEPIQIKIWVNLFPVDGPIVHVADTLLSITANLNGVTPLSIFVPPYQQATLKTRYTNTTGLPQSVFQLASHMHKRGVRFRAWKSDGSLYYENGDFEHPRLEIIDPPLVIAPGDFMDYECLHDNGVTRPIRRCGDAPHDAGCTPGEPVPVTFNTSAEDEMCFLTGLFY